MRGLRSLVTAAPGG